MVIDKMCTDVGVKPFLYSKSGIVVLKQRIMNYETMKIRRCTVIASETTIQLHKLQ